MPDLVKELEVRVKFISDVKKLAIPDSKKSYDSLEKLNKSLIDTIKLYKDITDKSPWAKEATAINKATAALSRYNAELAKGSVVGGGGYMGGGGGRRSTAGTRALTRGRGLPAPAASMIMPGGMGITASLSHFLPSFAGVAEEKRSNMPDTMSSRVASWWQTIGIMPDQEYGKSEKFSKQEEKIKEQRAYQAQLKQFRDAKQAREIGRIGEGASFKLGLSQYDSPAYRRETARGVMGEQGRLAQGTEGTTQAAHLQAQMEAAKVMKSAQEDINRAKAKELDTEGKIVDQQQRKVELLKAQLDRAKEINNATASSVGRASTSEINRAKELMAKIKGGGELTGREADFLTKFGPAGSKIADDVRQKMGREKGGSLIADLDRAAGFDVEGKQ